MNFNKKFIDKIINVTSNAAIACYQHLGKKDKILVDDIAKDIKSTSYVILSNIGGRTERKYIN